MSNSESILVTIGKINEKKEELIAISEKLNSSLLSNSSSIITYLKSELNKSIDDLNELMTNIKTSVNDLIDE